MQEFEQDFIIAIYAIPHEGKILVSARNFCNTPNDIVLSTMSFLLTDVVDSEMRKYRADIIARAKQILQPFPVIAGNAQDVDMQEIDAIQLQDAIVIEDTFSDTFPLDWGFCKISACAPQISLRIIFIVGLWALQKGHVVNNVLKKNKNQLPRNYEVEIIKVHQFLEAQFEETTKECDQNFRFCFVIEDLWVLAHSVLLRVRDWNRKIFFRLYITRRPKPNHYIFIVLGNRQKEV